MWQLLYVVGYLVSAVGIAGMFYAHDRGEFPTLDSPVHVREALGMSIMLGAFYALIWPIGLPVAWLLTGFAYHGVWIVKRPESR